MVKQKKKAPGRPKKEFVSRKPKTKIQAWPGRPRKDKKDGIIKTKQVANTPKVVRKEKVSKEITSFVAKSVDESKKKDLIILVLFLLSFVLFIVSLYFTFIKENDPNDLSQAEKSEIMNIETGNIDYNTPGMTGNAPEVNIVVEEPTQQQQTVQVVDEQQQTIIDFYQAINIVDMDTLYVLTDSHLETSNVFKTYYNRRWLTNFIEAIMSPKIVVTNIQEVETTSTNPDIKSFEYTVEYILASTQQKYTEERSTTLIKKNNQRKVGKIMCETKWCSTMPFFNTEKYKK